MRANLRYYDGRRGILLGAVEELQTLKESVSSTSDINELRSIGRKCAKDILIRALTRFYAIRSHSLSGNTIPDKRGDMQLYPSSMAWCTQPVSQRFEKLHLILL